VFFFFQAEDGIRDKLVTGVQTCALPILVVGKFEGHGRGGPFSGADLGNAVVGVDPFIVPPQIVIPDSAASGNGEGGRFIRNSGRSEERRVGKEGRERGARQYYNENQSAQ